MQPDTPCTHADAGEARERAEDAWAIALDAAYERHCSETMARAREASAALHEFTRCPDCGLWREGER